MNRIVILLVLVFAVQFAVLCEAANVIVVPGTNGVFYVKAVDFVDVGGVEIELSYDSTALTNPRITQGDMLASTMFVPNTAFKANTVKIAAMSLSPIKGSGDLAILSFDLKSSAPGTVAISRKILASSRGSSLSTASSGGVTDNSSNNSTNSASSTNTSGSSTSETGSGPSTSSSTGTSVAGVSMGTITLPQDQLATGDKRSEYQPLVTDLRKDMTLPVPGSDSALTSTKGSAGADSKQPDKSSVAYKSVLQMFREFKGERSPKTLLALFAEAVYPDFRQEPPVVLADGVKTVKLTLKLKPIGNESPKFILQGASVQQLRGEGEDYVWVVDAVPKKGVTEAKLTAVDGQRILEFPLVVAPVVDTALGGGAKTSEADFVKYLAKPAKYDLNKDGKVDLVDDYIYTANYIVAMKIKPEKLVEKPVKEPSKGDKKDGKKLDVKDEKKKTEPVKLPEVKQGGSDKGEKNQGKSGENKNGKPEDSIKKKPVTKKDDNSEGKAQENKSGPANIK